MNQDLSQLVTRMKVFQVCDSTFPIGTFNHSFGMESYIASGRITNASEFEEWLDSYMRTQFKYGDGLLCLLCLKALDEGDSEKLWDYDQIMAASTLAYETRNGNKLIAKQMLGLIEKIAGETPLLQEYKNRMSDGSCVGNPAIVFSIFAHDKGIDSEECFLMYGYSIASTMVQNAVRSVPLGQGDGQLVLCDVIDVLASQYPDVRDLDEHYLGANVPGLELAQITHETQIARLFMS